LIKAYSFVEEEKDDPCIL